MCVCVLKRCFFHPVISDPTEIYKKDGDIALTAKAYNGRVILEWLSETVYLACQDDTFVARDPRTFLIAAALSPGK